MNITAKVVQVLPMEGGTSRNGNQWQKASLIVEVAENPQYPKKVKISNMKNADAFSKIAIGSEVTFKVEIESREFNSRWYTEVNCWGWDIPQATPTQQPQPVPQAYPPQGYQQPYQQTQQPIQQDDNLPF